MRWFCSVLLAFIVVLAASSADARPRHKHKHYRYHAHHRVVHQHARHHVRHVRPLARGYQVASLGGIGAFAGAVSNGIVRASSGASARVNPQYASRFQCLVNGLEASGYRIRFMGGYRHTKIAGTRIWSKHASGRAIDINQTGRNRTVGRLPHSATAIASACGLTHGAVWRHADAGHFEVP